MRHRSDGRVNGLDLLLGLDAPGGIGDALAIVQSDAASIEFGCPDRVEPVDGEVAVARTE